jgi:FkbM family methyltransferase
VCFVNGRHQASSVRLGTASPAKLWLASILMSHAAGRLIGLLSANRVRHQGVWFDVRSSDFSPQVRAGMFWGSYEGAETRMIRDLLRGSTAVVELGSSLGVTTAHAANLMASGGRLVCVEANPRLLPGLRERLARRTAALRVDFIHAAVTDSCGEADFDVSPATESSRLAAARPQGAVAQGAAAQDPAAQDPAAQDPAAQDPAAQDPAAQPRHHSVRVPALTLREILRKTGVDEYELISDIEGAEAAFLLKDPDVLRGCRRAVIELHETTVDGRTVTVSELAEAATANGLRILRRHGPVIGLVRP